MFNFKQKATTKFQLNSDLEQKLAAARSKVKQTSATLAKKRLEAAEVIVALTHRLKEVGKLDRTLGVFEAPKHEGVLYVNYRGMIMFANKAACDLLKRDEDKLVHHKVDYILTGEHKRKLSLEQCSQLLLDAIKSSPEKACDVTKQCVLQTDKLAILLNEPTVLVLRSGDQLYPLRVLISLADTGLSELRDVTFICRLQALSSVPAGIQPLITVA